MTTLKWPPVIHSAAGQSIELNAETPVRVEAAALGPQLFDVTVVGHAWPGVLATITSALATEELNIVDLQLATYQEAAAGTPLAFVDVVHVILEDLASYERRNLLPAEEAQTAGATSRIDQTIISDHQAVER